VDKTFLTCEGIDLENGITEYDDQEADIKKSMAASAKQVVLMADADKFNRTSFIRFLELDRLHAIVTNEKPDENWRNFLAGTPIEWIW
jgi:DeoR/GlpR family transcriptional regulator of sugar metabolism